MRTEGDSKRDGISTYQVLFLLVFKEAQAESVAMVNSCICRENSPVDSFSMTTM
jgi:hypothetical protein